MIDFASDYRAFLATKHHTAPNAGVDVPANLLHPALFPFQRDATAWALRKGRAALFLTTGMGKTICQLVWATHAAERTLVLAPLAVARQTVREGERFGIEVTYARRQGDAAATGITITNYEMLDHFDAGAFGAVVLDESSIVKDVAGATRAKLIHTFRDTPMRLCCTATPAPNDIAELANHAEFLGTMTRVEMLAAWFVHDDDGWRMKGHARNPFYRWLASWALSLRMPSDLGYDDAGYLLPPLDIRLELVPTDWHPPDQLFPTTLKGVGHRAAVRKDTLHDRVARAVELVEAEPDEPWLVWCGLNAEQEALAAAFGEQAISVHGALSLDEKESRLLAWLNGERPILITKPSIAGHGLNMQRCARMVFVGLSDSFESYFQAIRRCYRFGQTRPVVATIVLTEPEEPIYHNVLRKEREAEAMAAELMRHVATFEREEIGLSDGGRDGYVASEPLGLPSWLGRAS